MSVLYFYLMDCPNPWLGFYMRKFNMSVKSSRTNNYKMNFWSSLKVSKQEKTLIKIYCLSTLFKKMAEKKGELIGFYAKSWRKLEFSRTLIIRKWIFTEKSTFVQ